MYLKISKPRAAVPRLAPYELKKCHMTLVWFDLGARSPGLDLTKTGKLRQMEVKTRYCCSS